MLKKLFAKAKAKAPNSGVDELAQLYEEIDDKQRKIAEEKAKLREERLNGARTTKHRFTV
ncbi:hypothetical protein NGC23_07490 [Leclercia pneumoniae]|uniref:hypothetical protein n=1 Tax=Leclercia pneumoniae TaxID=2815358 RepID=UPI002DBB627C|nr:hypothetical protein [Leclercia pneumoniae]MEB7500032.1 hypothetical protein [Leclercia pneumoniae]